jgi:PAT family beta-lactamase induction signal transducer AmpG
LTRERSTLWLGGAAAILYFSEGLPYGIVKDFVPLYLRVRHIDLTSIGLLNAVGFAWTFKFAWSPFVDALGTYRRWISSAVAVIAASLAGMALVQTLGPIWYAFVAILAVASATQDIAVDAFTIRATPNDLLGPINSVRVTAYRIALVMPGALAFIGQKFGWPWSFGVVAIAATVILATTLALPSTQHAAHNTNFLEALKHWLTKPKAGALLAVAFTYRLGELTIVSMIRPYWVDRGYPPAEIGMITSVIGVIVSIIGAIAGGAIVARFGIYRSLIALGVAQSLSNLGYALVATLRLGRWSIYAAAVVENLGFGLGTAAFLAFLMSICDKERAATEYALLSAAFGFTGTLMASVSGIIAQHAGYPIFFWLTVILGIPALFILPFVRSEVAT